MVLKRVEQPSPQWAWLPMDEVEDVHVIVVEGPEAIFLRLSKFYDNLERLMKEIQKHASIQKQPSNCHMMLEEGDCCLGKPSESEEWNRALVRGKPTEDTVELFFVDFGDTEVVPWSHVLPIPDKFITQLPFQIIECFLFGVKFLYQDPDDQEWEDEVINMIYDITQTDDEVPVAKRLSVKASFGEEKGLYTDGRRYSVVLADCSVEPLNPSFINSIMASSNYAVPAILMDYVREDDFDDEDFNFLFLDYRSRPKLAQRG
ncbi:tudor domain-containing protein 1-like isoform X2 [Macrosteles quadrilineatus]|nr:tudor domain-containing protein 1-like isoform X2 [Macrosteles quadrilineatus]